MFTDAVILAGGFGERLWPASKPEYPKQFLSLEEGISFLQSSILRAAALNLKGKILIITRIDLLEPTVVQCSTLAQQLESNLQKKIKEDLIVIAEPEPKHTAAPAILACQFLDKMFPNTEHFLLVLTSDHAISPIESFTRDCRTAFEYAHKDNFVCFAIKPTEPATGFGYIKSGTTLGKGEAFQIAEFKEKPDFETARKYIESETYWWNSGMFAFGSSFFKEELKKCEPDIYTAFEEIPFASLPAIKHLKGIKYVKDWDAMKKAYDASPAISMDKAVAERTRRACAVKATFSWDDVGSWDAFGKMFSAPPEKTAFVKSSNCFVYSDIPVAICGVDDLIVVIKNGNALVAKKGSSTLVREAAQKMNSLE